MQRSYDIITTRHLDIKDVSESVEISHLESAITRRTWMLLLLYDEERPTPRTSFIGDSDTAKTETLNSCQQAILEIYFTQLQARGVYIGTLNGELNAMIHEHNLGPDLADCVVKAILSAINDMAPSPRRPVILYLLAQRETWLKL